VRNHGVHRHGLVRDGFTPSHLSSMSHELTRYKGITELATSDLGDKEI
jgi:hypothetical protein